jgi:molecular chaperone GrpE (heat shock protein)
MATTAELPNIRLSPSSSRKSTPKNRKAHLPKEEPPLPLEAWEKVGMTKEEFEEMVIRVKKELEEWNQKRLIDFMSTFWDSVDDMQRRLDELDRFREKYNRMAGWSADVMQCVDAIDEEMYLIETRLDEIFSEIDRMEYNYD